MLNRTARRGLSAVVLVTAGLALAACSPNGSAASSSSSGSVSSSGSAGTGGTGGTGGGGSASAAGAPGSSSTSASGTSGSTGTSTTSGGTGTSATSAGSSVPTCATSQLQTTAENFNSGAGSTMFQLVFVNDGSAPCTLRGYPGVSFVKAHNVQVGKAASRTSGSSVSTVTLIPHAHAYADVRTVNGQGGFSTSQCDLTTVPTLRVYPPNQTESTNIPWNKSECVGSGVQNLQVGAVYATK
jgi:uncharacterized protein DUF4232